MNFEIKSKIDLTISLKIDLTINFLINVERMNTTLNHSPELETYLKINVSLATKTSAPGRL